jgi:UDP-N-acetylmuramoyl-L-alanyl-D-glutamate--2,6-diaminopimelate ligase
MDMRALLEGLTVAESRGDMGTPVRAIRYDSRRVEPGDLFVALRGGAADGHDYVGDALNRGAAAILAESRPEAGVPYAVVSDTREALAHMANVFYGRPSRELSVIGVTGTNGKTTTAHLLRSILEASGRKTGMLGTISYCYGDICIPAPFTTPEAPEFQGILRQMKDGGCTDVVTEVSSHALVQKRVEFTRFEAAVFTNLTSEHLDFHRSMEEYFGAKRRLFEEFFAGTAVLNADDFYGRELEASLPGPRVTYGIHRDADLRAADVRLTGDGLSFVLVHDGRRYPVASSLAGLPNVSNILAAAGAAVAVGVRWEDVLEGIARMRQVEGRFEKVQEGQDFLCVIDFAHTPDALERLIETAREITGGRVITVFGSGGDRDRSKRPVMGAAATRLSDLVFITSDNPRSEEPLSIIGEIAAGAAKENFRIVPDRAQAIGQALSEARPMDTVLIAGKGHEQYQEAAGRRLPFSDRETVRAVLATLTRARKGGSAWRT